ncbi:hypothetical protein LCGC14_1104560 [marine sediment metagenome]|uniref:Uncharacterized protein n=1 Tax=marine sediment metagenome TaxID=412755 RepID=A0A0F9PRK1_9ZZZZ
MSDLTGKLPKNTYKDLLQVSNSNSGIDTTKRAVEDGEGTASPLELSDTAVNVSSGFELGGTAVQAGLADIGALANTDSNIIVGNGSNWIVESGATARTSLGAAALGANSDITSLTGLTTPLTVAQGGAGAATFTDGGVLLGSGTGAFTAMAVLADGEFIVGDGTTDPVAESGVTVQASLGLSYASQTEQETGTATDKVVAPGTQHNHDSAAKLWLSVLWTTGTPDKIDSYNISSITDTAQGRLTITYDTDFSAEPGYAVVAMAENASGSTGLICSHESAQPVVGATIIDINAADGTTLTDPVTLHVVGFGDQ